MENNVEQTRWNPLEKAFGQARDFNDQAVQFALDTASDLRQRSEAAIESARQSSEAALQSARERSEDTLRVVRDNLENAQKNIEEQAETFDLVGLRKSVQDQVEGLEKRLRGGVLAMAKSMDIATAKEIDSLRRKVLQLEKRITELTRDTADA